MECLVSDNCKSPSQTLAFNPILFEVSFMQYSNSHGLKKTTSFDHPKMLSQMCTQLCSWTSFCCVAGVADYKLDRWHSLLTITQTPGRGIADHRQLLKKLKKATHKKKAVLLPPRAQPASTTTTVYIGYPVVHGPGYLMPWPPSTPSSSSSFITNPNYFQHPAGCGHCWGYSDISCANCGRGNNFGWRSAWKWSTVK